MGLKAQRKDDDTLQKHEKSAFTVACVAGVIGAGEGERGGEPHIFPPLLLPLPWPGYAGHAGYIHRSGRRFCLMPRTHHLPTKFLVMFHVTTVLLFFNTVSS